MPCRLGSVVVTGGGGQVHLKCKYSMDINGEANNFKMELFDDIHEGSGVC